MKILFSFFLIFCHKKVESKVMNLSEAHHENTDSLPKVSEDLKSVENDQVFKKEEAFLEEIKSNENNREELTEKICEFLEKEEKPGSAAFVKVFSESAALDKELKDLSAGKDPSELKMLDPKTTTEMVKDGKAYLNKEAVAKIISNTNNLKYRINKHITSTAQNAADYYAAEITRKRSIKEVFTGKKINPGEVPLLPNEQETERLHELADRKYTSQEEIEKTFQDELNFMMKNRPQMIGLVGSERVSKQLLPEIVENLGGIATEPKNIENTKNLHEDMRFLCREELGIYSGFLDAIENAVEK